MQRGQKSAAPSLMDHSSENYIKAATGPSLARVYALVPTALCGASRASPERAAIPSQNRSGQPVAARC